VKDYGIGVGLYCSQQLARALGGDVKLIDSTRQLTHFQIKISLYSK
jgi:sensor histidine kinase regulating citrate/malate metabolism